MINGAVPGKAGQRLREGDVVEFEEAPPVAATPLPQALDLPIVHSDRWLAVAGQQI